MSAAIVTVALARPYDVRIGAGALDALDAAVAGAGLADATAYFIVADRAAGEATARVRAALARTAAPVRALELDVSEQSKSMAVLDDLYGAFIDARLDRRAVVVAVGGGVIGDLAGYAAATFVRGIRWIGIPTTLLAAVDSAIGGKTAINHRRGKNLIGAVHQPALVVVDRSTFATLPARETISGYGEMLKYGLALDAPLWADLLAAGPHGVDDGAIERCIARKAEIVARDEFDREGIRETLNFGHTLGHAIEAVTGYARYRHGEAVILGMRAALRISTARGHLAPAVADDADAALARVAIPALPALDAGEVLAAAHRDKKKAPSGALRFVLLRAIGETVPDDRVTDDDMRAALRFLETACASPS